MEVVIIGLVKEDGSTSEKFLGDKNGIIKFKDVDEATFHLLVVSGYTEEEIMAEFNFYYIEEEALKDF